MNRIKSIHIILICAVLLGVGVVWYTQIRLKPITAYIPPVGSEPFPQPVGSDVPTTSPIQQPKTSDEPADTRSWGERMRDAIIPDVPGVTWQRYTNKDYGFQMEYPKGWTTKTDVDNKNFPQYINFNRFPPHKNSYTMNTLSFRVSNKNLQELAKEDVDLTNRFQRRDTTPDAIIHDINIFIYDPDTGSDNVTLTLYFEGNGHSYTFIEPWFTDNKDKAIIEHMIKSFHFIQ